MKIALTGGGTGGHFYPLIAVTEAVYEYSYLNQHVDPKLYYFGPEKYDEIMLTENRIVFRKVISGKNRIGYGHGKNIADLFKIGIGYFQALWKLFNVYPDVLFSKGGYTSVPVVLAAATLRIPIVIHDSDTVPGRASLLASRFATKIAVSYPTAAEYFTEKNQPKVAHTGQPIRDNLLKATLEGSHDYFGLDESVATLLIVGGSQGAQNINDEILTILPRLVEKYQVIHQTGPKLMNDVLIQSKLVLENSDFKNRYIVRDFLSDNELKKAAGVSSLVITRAGSMLFEFANWGLPTLIIPLPESISRDQRKNAYTVARLGAGVVVEENNMSANLLLAQIDFILEDAQKYQAMSTAARAFAGDEGALKIARALYEIGLKHEKN